MDNVELRLMLCELGGQCSNPGNDLLDIEVMLQTQFSNPNIIVNINCSKICVSYTKKEAV